VLVEPWLTPDAWRPGTVHALFIDEPELKLARINTSQTADRLAVTPADHMLSWLPLTHDMGFGGALCLALHSDLELTLLPTALFAQSPLNVLHAMSQQRATLSPNPPSAYALLARLGRRAAREGIDLSHWRFVGRRCQFAHVLRALNAAGAAPVMLQPPAHGRSGGGQF
jgi:acyl-CoA synthetase (AMP-forming)/AMP-acid ligase II